MFLSLELHVFLLFSTSILSYTPLILSSLYLITPYTFRVVGYKLFSLLSFFFFPLFLPFYSFFLFECSWFPHRCNSVLCHTQALDGEHLSVVVHTIVRKKLIAAF